MPTVREATFDVWRQRGLTTIFANPGSTEISLLTDLPDDLRFVLALHESSVVGIATGWALARGEPALAILHTTAGLGNAVGAIATARVNRAPLVIVVGQQDRRHLAHEPFLAGKLLGLAGEYPVWVDQPVRPQDVPGAVARAYNEALTGDGAGARDRADGRLGRRGRARRPARRSDARRSLARGGRRLGRAARRIPRFGREAGARRRRRRRRAGDLGRARRVGRAARVRRVAGVVQRPRRLPSGSQALRRSSPCRSHPSARDAVSATTPCSRWVRRSSGSTRTSLGRSSRRARGLRW